MSIGRVPELLFAFLIMGALGLLGMWIKTSEVQAHRLWVLECRYRPRAPFPESIPGTAANRPSPTGGIEEHFRRLYPRYAWRLTLIRLRLDRLQRMAGPPLFWLLLPGLAEALRRRAEKHAGLLAFPNEIVFHLGLWLTVLGAAGPMIGYVLSPVAVPPGFILILLAGGLTLGGLAVLPNIPRRWRHAN